jgi:hypothetical protein
VTDERPTRFIRTIVCTFAEELPADDLQVFRRFEHAVAKAGWNIRVRLEPIGSLPERYEVLVVSPALRQRAEALQGDAILIVTTRQTAAAAVDQLLRELARGDPIAAERKDPNAPKIVTHRGIEIL